MLVPSNGGITLLGIERVTTASRVNRRIEYHRVNALGVSKPRRVRRIGQRIGAVAHVLKRRRDRIGRRTTGILHIGR